MDKNFRILAEVLNFKLNGEKHTGLTDEQKQYANAHFLHHVAYYTKKKSEVGGRCLCMECYKTFPALSSQFEYVSNNDGKLYDPYEAPKNAQAFTTCPHCGQRVEVIASRRRTLNETVQCATIDKVNGIEVKRVFEIENVRNANRNYTWQSEWHEVLRVFKQGDDSIIAACSIAAFPYNRSSPFNRWSDIDIHFRKANSDSYYYEMNYAEVDNIVPISQTFDFDIKYQMPVMEAIVEVLKSKAVVRRLVKRVFSVPMIETLVKLNRTDMAALIANDAYSYDPGHYDDAKRCFVHDTTPTINDFLTAAKICLRNDYYPSDMIIFFDYVRNLVKEHKDIHNAHYICAPDLLAAHGELLAKQRREHRKELERQRREREEREREAARRHEEYMRRVDADRIKREKVEEKDYKRNKQMYFGIAFGEDTQNLKFHVIGSIAEMREEGDSMEHCVYHCGYYRREDSLIVSCTCNDERLATIEINLRDFSIVQTRGKHNSTPKHLALINETIMQHMDEFRQAKAAQMALTAPTADEDEEPDYCPAAVVI